MCSLVLEKIALATGATDETDSLKDLLASEEIC